MVKKYVFGTPYKTLSVVNEKDTECIVVNDNDLNNQNTVMPNPFNKVELTCDGGDYFHESLDVMEVQKYKGFKAVITLENNSKVYGLGLQMGSINKRGRVYRSFCTDDPVHSEDKQSLYGAHNFIVINNGNGDTFGIFIDYPGPVVFDIGWTNTNELVIATENANLNIYYIKEETIQKVVHTFRTMIGKSYIPPFWAFGFMQSRWGYASKKDLIDVYENHKKHNLPLDAIFLDIDYMDGFRDFTYNKDAFDSDDGENGFSKCVKELLDKGIHVVPIIDAGIKAEKDFAVDREGVENNYYCKTIDGNDFLAAVWPGFSHFVDVTQDSSRKWFGNLCKKFLDDNNLSGFWLDMNEPAIFYSKDGVEEFGKKLVKWGAQCENPVGSDILTWKIKDAVLGVQNNLSDYKSFYHKVPKTDAGGLAQSTTQLNCNLNEKSSGLLNSENDVFVRHDKIHNLYGYLLTRAVGEAINTCSGDPAKTPLLFSRASFIGSHRYGGIWTGDNCSWWSHILLCLQQLPALNMAGYLYTGCDLGGFGDNTNRELLLRFLALGIFTPLMRNHSALGTRRQECYNFGDTDDFRAILSLRYRLLPYLYDEYLWAANNYELYFRPLAFDYNDSESQNCVDQLMLGRDIMIAPVYTPNATGRAVYLPCNMYQITCTLNNGCVTGDGENILLNKGFHWVKCLPNEIVFFIKEDHKIPICNAACSTKSLDKTIVTYWGCQ